MQQQGILFFFFTLISISTTLPRFLLGSTINIPGLRPNETDYEALLSIKARITSDDPNSLLASWGNNHSFHFCQWRGVTCGRRHSRVVSLDLSSNKLAGTLSPSIGNLSFLHSLNLSTNFFRGNIPHQISHLPRLQFLLLGQNSFEGEIPANLSRCLQLVNIYLANNKLVGRIPPELSLLPNLKSFTFSENSLSGNLHDIGIGNMTSLIGLYIDNNFLQGSIPEDVGRLQSLAYFILGYNKISGIIPPSLYNLSRLDTISVSSTGIHGNLPKDLSLHFPRLSILDIADTNLTGQVPVLSNLSMLNIIDMGDNSFTGTFSLDGKNMPHLKYLYIDNAFSSVGAIRRNLKFLDSLTNCTNLQNLGLSGYSYTGFFPPSILNLSTSLQVLYLESNHLSGQLPSGLSKLANLYLLTLRDNHFTGPIPADIGTLQSMVTLELSLNNFSNEIPSSFGNLSLLSNLYIEQSNLQGSIPKSPGNCLFLQNIYFTDNKLSGVIPAELFHASDLVNLVVTQNNLQGSLPAEISRPKNLAVLDVSQNRLSGEIPSALGGCTGLIGLDLSGNSFVGSIPESLIPLGSISYLDLSYNNLSGQIPSYFSNWSYLSYLNLSYNNFEGEVPLGGVFSNTSVVSVVGNSKLCGGVPALHLPSCPRQRESKRRRLSIRVIVIISVTSILTVVLAVALCFYLVCSSKTKKTTSFGSQKKPFLEVSYQMLSSATDEFSPSNLIGVGGFGSVYKGILRQDENEMMVAVKVLNLQNKGAGKSFMAECNALRDIRHRNLCKIITVCSSIDTQRNDFKALVYEFMPRGSLEGWLHSSNLVANENVDDDLSCGLSIVQRVSIAIDVASALEYLHIRCANPIIHCDLKPNNILLDDEMIAHVGDFGLAKIISDAAPTSDTMRKTSSTQVRGTVGYAAPEYGLGSKVSPEGDIYSFGIILLEMMTSKKPTDSMFNNNLNLHEYSKSALPDQLMKIIDQRMLGDVNVLHPRCGGDIRKIECIKSLITVGVHCSMAQPQERMSISNALNELKSARRKILSNGPRN